MDKSKFYLTPNEIHRIYCVREDMSVPCFEDCGERIARASANHAIKTLVEWMLRFRHDCIECGWTITPEYKDWQELVKLVEDM